MGNPLLYFPTGFCELLETNADITTIVFGAHIDGKIPWYRKIEFSCPIQDDNPLYLTEDPTLTCFQGTGNVTGHWYTHLTDLSTRVFVLQ